MPLARERVYVYLVESAPRGTPGPGSDTPDTLRSRFGGISKTLDGVFDALRDDTPIHHGDLEDRTRICFGEGRLLLLGDAAHPMTPNTGQGAGTAIEDAAALALLWDSERPDPEALIAAMDAERRQRVTQIVKLSWRIGQVAHWENRLACAIRNALLRATPPATAAKQARQMWQPGIDLAAQLR